MTDSLNSEQPHPGPEGEPRTTFLDSLAIILRWKKFVIVNVVIVVALATAVSFILPKWYRATASVLPPKQPDLFGAASSAGSLLKSLTSLGRLGQKASSYNYFAILRSRTVSEEIVRRFDLITVYDIADTSMEKTLKELEGNVNFEEQVDEFITIEVLDKDPARAAAMANAYVDLLNSTSIKLGSQEARNNREFIGRRLDSAWADLRRAEDTMRRYQEKSGMMISPEQAESIKPIADLYGMKARKELELAVLVKTTSPDNPAVQQLELELSELGRKLAGIPEIGLQSIRFYRDVLIQQRIVEFLTPLFEQSRIDEQKDVPVVLVLDRAVSPERKTKPQRFLIVFLASTLTLLLSLVFAYLLHGYAQHKPKMKPLEEKLHRYARHIAARYKIPLP